MKGITNIIIFTISLSLIVLVTTVISEIYNVGDEEGWTTGVNYLTWAQKNKFYVGDVLVFNYIQSQHNTCEVTKATYMSCNSSSGVLTRYESGNDMITLNEAKTYWFICDIPGHCLGGMRFSIDLYDNTSQLSPPPVISKGSSSYASTKTSGIEVILLVVSTVVTLKVLQ